MSDEEFQKILLEKFDDFEKKFNKRIDTLEKNINIRFDKLDNRIENLDTNNANRHIDLNKEIIKIKNDLNTIEKVTVKNWTDITELKEAK